MLLLLELELLDLPRDVDDPLEPVLPEERLPILLPELRLEDVVLRTLLELVPDLVDEVPLFLTTADRVLVVTGGEDTFVSAERIRREDPVVPDPVAAVLRCRRLLLPEVLPAAVDFASCELRWDVVITEGLPACSRE